MKVEILKDLMPGSVPDVPNFVRVYSYALPRYDDVKVAVVEHHYPSPDQGSPDQGTTDTDSGSRRNCLTLVDHERMSHAVAMKLALEYATQTGVPVLYEREEDFSDGEDMNLVLETVAQEYYR